MPNVPVTSPALDALSADNTRGRKPSADAREGFLALLDTGRRSSDFSGQEETAGQKSTGPGRSRKEMALNAVAVPVAPVPLPVSDTGRAGLKDVGAEPRGREASDDDRGEIRPLARPQREEPTRNNAPEKNAGRRNEAAETPAVESPDAPRQSETASQEEPAVQETPAAEAAPAQEATATETPASDTAGQNAPAAVVQPFLERLQNLMQQFLQDLEGLIAGGGGIESIVALMREFHNNIRQTIADLQAALQNGGTVQSPAVTPAAAQPAAQNQAPQVFVADALATDTPPQENASLPVAEAVQEPQVSVQVQEGRRQAASQSLLPQVQTPAAQVGDVAADDALENFAANAALAAAQDKRLKPETQAQADTSAQAVAGNDTVSSAQGSQQNNIPAPAAAASPDGGAGNRGGQQPRDGQNGASQPAAFAAAQAGASARAERADAPAFARLLSPSTQVEVIEQVKVHIRTAIRDGSSDIRVQLRPEELGRLDIRIHIHADGKAMLTVTADNRDTFELLQRDARSLEQALADAGLKSDAGSMQFNLRGGQQGHDHAEHRHRLPVIPQSLLEEEPVDLGVISHHYHMEMPEGIDIKI